MLQEISAVISGLQASVGIISATLQAKSDSDALREVIKLQSQIAQIQDIAIKLRTEHMNLMSEIDRLKSWKKEKSKYVLKQDHFHFFAKKPKHCANEAEMTARFCANCFYDNRLSIITYGGGTHGNNKKMICHTCKSNYLVPGTAHVHARQTVTDRDGITIKFE